MNMYSVFLFVFLFGLLIWTITAIYSYENISLIRLPLKYFIKNNTFMCINLSHPNNRTIHSDGWSNDNIIWNGYFLLCHGSFRLPIKVNTQSGAP